MKRGPPKERLRTLYIAIYVVQREALELKERDYRQSEVRIGRGKANS